MLLLAAGHLKFIYNCNYDIQVSLVLKLFKTYRYILFKCIQVHIIHVYHAFKNN